MFLQNLTLLAGNTVVQVTNIAPASAVGRSPQLQAEIARLPPTPVIAAPILPAPQSVEPTAAPQRSSLIIVSTSAPGSMGSATVYTGEPNDNGLEAARRAAQAAADHQWLQQLAHEIGEEPGFAEAAADRARLQAELTDLAKALWQPIDAWLGMPSNRDAAIRAYAEAARLGAPDPLAEAAQPI